MILDLSLLVLGNEKLFPPSTGVEAMPKLQGPEDTFSWNSFRHTRKKVSHWSTAQRSSFTPGAPSQQAPLCRRPLTFCIDRMWSSKRPEAEETCREGRQVSDQQGAPHQHQSIRTEYLYQSSTNNNTQIYTLIHSNTVTKLLRMMWIYFQWFNELLSCSLISVWSQHGS